LNDEVEAGKLPEIRVLSDDDVVIAHVLQAMSLELEAGYGLLNAWQADCVTADIVDVHMPQLIDREQIIGSYYLDKDDTESAEGSYYCMHDHRYIRSSNGIRLADGRFVCQQCAPNGVLSAPAWIGSALSDAIYKSCHSAIHDECKAHGIPIDLEMVTDLVEHCRRFIVNLQEGTWQDAWNGIRKYMDATRTHKHMVSNVHGAIGQRAAHFLKPGVDHCLPYTEKDGVRFKHFVENCVLLLARSVPCSLVTFASDLDRVPQTRRNRSSSYAKD
jgi:hypothetical protein